MNEKILFCDLAIKGRFRVALWDRDDGLSACEQYAAGTAEEFEKATLSFLEDQGSPFLAGAALAAPGWEQDGVQHMPNHGYDLDRDWLRRVFNVKRLNIVNPTVARALSIQSLGPEDYEVVNGGDGEIDGLKCIIGTGPGLGIAMLIKDSFGDWSAFSGAGGHSDLVAIGDVERALFDRLSAKFGHVSTERAVSLAGLGEIWSGLCVIDGLTEPAEPSADTVVTLAAGGDRRALQAIQLCATWLARAAADIALMTGARGGIYLTGELMDRLDPYIDRKDFRTRFQDKGRLAGYLESVPLFFITSPEIEFRGLATLFT